MQSYEPSKMIRIYVNEEDRFDSKPLYEAIVDQCRATNIAGATVFRGEEGFGATAEIHRPHLLNHTSPVMITIVDTDENIQRLLPRIEHMVESGLLVASDVVMRRVNRGASNRHPINQGSAAQ